MTTPATPATPNTPAATTDVGNPGPQQQTATGKEPTPAATTPPEPAKANEGTGEEAPQKRNAPESYTYKPSEEGLTVGDGVASAMSDVFRELDLTQDAAQKIVDKVSPALRAQTQANIKAMVDGWETELQADATVGGSKLPESLALAEKALALGSPELRQLLGSTADGGTGLGRHKAVVQWLAEIGRRLTPDPKNVVGGSPSPVSSSDPLARLAASYGKQ